MIIQNEKHIFLFSSLNLIRWFLYILYTFQCISKKYSFELHYRDRWYPIFKPDKQRVSKSLIRTVTINYECKGVVLTLQAFEISFHPSFVWYWYIVYHTVVPVFLGKPYNNFVSKIFNLSDFSLKVSLTHSNVKICMSQRSHVVLCS